jgi:hypothetical protein
MDEDYELTPFQRATQRIIDRYTLPDGTVRMLPSDEYGKGRLTRALRDLDVQQEIALAQKANSRF